MGTDKYGDFRRILDTLEKEKNYEAAKEKYNELEQSFNNNTTIPRDMREIYLSLLDKGKMHLATLSLEKIHASLDFLSNDSPHLSAFHDAHNDFKLKQDFKEQSQVLTNIYNTFFKEGAPKFIPVEVPKKQSLEDSVKSLNVIDAKDVNVKDVKVQSNSIFNRAKALIGKAKGKEEVSLVDKKNIKWVENASTQPDITASKPQDKENSSAPLVTRPRR
jgi:hypothetical protein